MKKYLVILLSIVLVALSACGDKTSSNDAQGSSNEEQEKVELTFMMWGNQDHIDMYNELIAEFETKNPNIKVKIESVPFPDYQQKVTVLAAGRELPDIAWASERMVPQFIDNGILSDVSALQSDPEFDMDDIYDSTLELFNKEGKLYGIPFSTPPHLIFYNKTLFEKNSLKTPIELEKEGNWTWDEFMKASNTIANNEERVYGANLFRDWKYWVNLLPHTWSYGGDLFNEDVTDFTWNTSEGEQTWKMLEQMMFKDNSHPKAGEQVNFEAGNIGMYFDVYSYVSKAREIKDFEWDIAPIPEGPNGRKPLLGEAGYVLFKDSKHPEETLKLLSFFAGKRGMEASSTFFVPPRKSVMSSDVFVNQPNNPPRESIELAVMGQMQNARLLSSHPKWQNIDNEILTGLDKLFAQSQSVEEILKKMDEEVDLIVSE